MLAIGRRRPILCTLLEMEPAKADHGGTMADHEDLPIELSKYARTRQKLSFTIPWHARVSQGTLCHAHEVRGATGGGAHFFYKVSFSSEKPPRPVVSLASSRDEPPHPERRSLVRPVFRFGAWRMRAVASAVIQVHAATSCTSHMDHHGRRGGRGGRAAGQQAEEDLT